MAPLAGSPVRVVLSSLCALLLACAAPAAASRWGGPFEARPALQSAAEAADAAPSKQLQAGGGPGAAATGPSLLASAGLSNSDVSVHLFEWSWEDVALECESFLGPAGFKAVQVSPPQEDPGGNQWWSRYQPVSYKLLSRSGNQAQFADMVRRCAAAGVDVIVDAVLNHMASEGSGSGTGRAGTPFGPGCRRFPEMYSCNDFHHNDGDCCSNCQVDSDTDLWRIRNCDLGLPDLATGSDWVRQKLGEYLCSLADLNVTGIRVDAAKHIPPEDLATIIARFGNSKLCFNLEIIIPPWAPCAVDIQQNYDIGRVWEFKLPRLLSDAFKPADRRLDLLAQIGTYSGTQWAASDRAVSFVVNHDRLMHGSDRPYTVTSWDGRPLYTLALVFMLAHPFGQPSVLSSTNFSPADLSPGGDYSGAPVDPATGQLLPVHAPGGQGEEPPPNCGQDKPYLCEHRWREVAAMVRWRAVAGASAQLTRFQVLNSNAAVALARGSSPGGGGPSRAFVLINAAWKEGMEVRQRMDTGLPAGAYCNVLAGPPSVCSSPIIVGPDGTAELAVPLMSAVALHVEALAPTPPA